MTVARLFTPMLACLATGCTSGSQRAPGVTQAKEVDQRTSAEVSPQTMPEFTKIVISVKTLAADTEWVHLPTVGDTGEVSFKDYPLDAQNSFFQCGHQRRGVVHSGDSFAVSGPITFRMVGTDPLSYASPSAPANIVAPTELLKRIRPYNPYEGAPVLQSRSVIWVEPADDPQTVIVTTDPLFIDSFTQSALGGVRQVMPELKLEFRLELGEGGKFHSHLLFGEGTEYWGATVGPVRLNGKTYRNLRGARVVNGQLLGR